MDQLPSDHKVPFHRVVLDAEDEEAVLSVLRSGWLSTGQKVTELEHAVAEFVGVPHAVATNSGTAALHTMYASLGLRPGDEVLVPAITFSASAATAWHAHLRPVLVDVDAETLAMDPLDAQRHMTKRTRAALVVHYPGVHADVALLREALGPEVLLLEDAAHALPCRDARGHAGSSGTASVFSFYATKTVTCGEVGMLLTREEGLATRARSLSLHGITRSGFDRYRGGSWRYDILEFGYKYNLTDIAAALALRQLAISETLRSARQRIATQYDYAFATVPELQITPRHGGSFDSWHLYPLRLHLDQLQCARDDVVRNLARRGIATSVHFIPLNLLTAYQRELGWRPGDVPEAERQFPRLLSLPIWPRMGERDVHAVIDAVLDVVGRYGLRRSVGARRTTTSNRG